MKIIIIITLSLSLSTGVYTQIVSTSCPNVSVVQNFDVAAYAGKWYEQQKYPFIFELGGKCITAEYSLNPNGTVRVLNQQINILTGNPSSIEGTARLDSTSGEGKLLVNFPSVPFNIDAPYWILSTDYERYSVVWSCANIPLIGLKIRTAWILTRERNPPSEIINKALNVFKSQELPTIFLIATNQKKCSS